MPVGPAPSLVADRVRGDLDPVALHRQNIARLHGPHVIVASYPGAGAAYLGNLLLCLGQHYIDPYTEELDDMGRARPAAQRVEYRRRLAAAAHHDVAHSDAARTGAARATTSTRFVKSHLTPAEFPRPQPVVLLVRDPRDTLHSYFHWRRGFSEEGENRALIDFLTSDRPLGSPPPDHWADFHHQWCTAWPTYPTVVTFEDLKRTPETTITTLFTALDLRQPERDELRQAIAASSFTAMRRHEDTVAGGDPRRIMRRGEPGEWREWCHGDLAQAFSDRRECAERAAHFGYHLTTTRTGEAPGEAPTQADIARTSSESERPTPRVRS